MGGTARSSTSGQIRSPRSFLRVRRRTGRRTLANSVRRSAPSEHFLGRAPDGFDRPEGARRPADRRALDLRHGGGAARIGRDGCCRDKVGAPPSRTAEIGVVGGGVRGRRERWERRRRGRHDRGSAIARDRGVVLSEYGHLLPAYRRQAGLPDEERIAWIRADRWLDFEQARGALARLDDLLSYPPRDRMPCLLLYGDTGMGKTKIIRKFLRDHPPTFDKATGVTTMPVVAMQMPAEPAWRRASGPVHRLLGSRFRSRVHR